MYYNITCKKTKGEDNIFTEDKKITEKNLSDSKLLSSPSPFSEQQVLLFYKDIESERLSKFPRYCFSNNDYKLKSKLLLNYVKAHYNISANEITRTWLRKHKLDILNRIFPKNSLIDFLEEIFPEFNLCSYKGKIQVIDVSKIKNNILNYLEKNNLNKEFLYTCNREFFDKLGTKKLLTSDEVFKCVADILELKKYAFKHSTSHKYWNKNELKNEIKWLLKSLNKNIYELSINDLKSYRLDEGIAQVYNRDYYKFLKDISRNTNLNKCKIFDELYRFKISLCKDIIRDVKTNYNFKYLRELKLNDIPEKYIKDIKTNFNGLRGFKTFAVDNFNEVKIIGKYGNIIS